MSISTARTAPSPFTGPWRDAIIQDYLASVDKSKSDDEDELEDRGSDFDTDEDMEDSDESVIDLSLDEIVVPTLPASDIDEDDDAFSSDDEYGEESDLAREEMKLKKSLIMGTVPDSLKCSSFRLCTSLRFDLLKQLECAEQEYAEITGTPLVTYTRRSNDEPEEVMIARLKLTDAPLPVHEFRLKSSKEVCDEDRVTLLREIVLLAQAVFRKERLIKNYAI